MLEKGHTTVYRNGRKIQIFIYFTFFGVGDERDDEDDDDEDVRDEHVPEVGVVFRGDDDGTVAALARRRVHEALDGEGTVRL